MAGGLAEAIFSWLGSVVDALAGLAASVLDLLPDAEDLNLEIPSGWIIGYTWANTVLPLTEALGLMTAVIAINVGAVVYRAAVVAWHLIPKPGIGT